MVVTMVQFSEQKLKEYIAQPQSFENDLPELESSPADKCCSLDKSWEAIHFILTGTNIGKGKQPLSMTVYSEQFFDEEQDLGMGPASYLKPEQVIEISNLLNEFDRTKVQERYDPIRMDEIGIYPTFWSKNPDGLFEYVFETFSELQSFFKDASSKRHSIASYIG